MPRTRKTPARDVTVYLPYELFDAVDQASASEGIPRSHFIERILAHHLNIKIS